MSKEEHSGIKLEASETSSISANSRALVCRVCLGSDADNKHMQLTDLSGAYRDSTVYEHINSVTDIQIHIEDSLPDKICIPCLLDLGTVIDFRERCVKSNTALQYAKNQICKYESEKDIKEEKQEVQVDTEEDDYNTFNNSFEVEPPVSSIDCTEQLKQYHPASNTEVICNECNEVQKSKCKLRTHWKKEHLPGALTCQICKRMFKSYKAYNTHRKTKPRNCLGTQHAIIEGVGKNRIFGCPNCSYSTKKSCSFACHYRIHTGVKEHHCKICPNKSFGQLSELQHHMEVTHGEVRLEITCEYCGKHVRGRHRVYRHLKRHSTKRYQCDICKKFYKNRNTLIVHLLQHNEVKLKSHKCNQCPKWYYTASALWHHRQVHSKDDWFYCDICSWKSPRKQSLNQHRAKHNDHNVCCNICGLFFKEDSRLQRHLELHGKKQSCGVCGKEFMKRWNLVCHLRKMHIPSSVNIENNK